MTGRPTFRRAGVALFAAAIPLLAPARPSAAAPDRPPAVLASYSFDDDVATGPDTFAVWQGARHTKGGRGRVSLQGAFHVSGHRSVELRDVPGDGDFPELQGYFPVRTKGRLFFHFAFLITDPKEELNIALAGPRFFQLEKDGLAFWLGTRDGRLVHYSDSIPKKLFVPEPFAWHAVDVSYDIPSGTYDLLVRREGSDAPLVSLRNQANSTRQPGSAIDKFSFVGAPFSDRSSVVYYVDDVVIGTDESVARTPFVAPGRRKLFIDSFVEYQLLLRERPRCLPPLDPADLGFTPDDLAAVQAAGLSDVVTRLMAGERRPRSASPERGGEAWRRVLDASHAWGEGCAALEAGRAASRSLPLRESLGRRPGGPDLPPLGRPRPGRAEEDRRGGRAAGPSLRVAQRPAVRRGLGLRGPRPRRPRPRCWSGSGTRPSKRSTGSRRGRARRSPSRCSSPSSTTTSSCGRVRTTTLATTPCAWRSARAAPAVAPGRGACGRPTRPSTAATWRRPASCTGRALEGERDHDALREIYLRLADLAFLDGDLGEERRLREHYYGALGE